MLELNLFVPLPEGTILVGSARALIPCAVFVMTVQHDSCSMSFLGLLMGTHT
jgi:hypothetical protein